MHYEIEAGWGIIKLKNDHRVLGRDQISRIEMKQLAFIYVSTMVTIERDPDGMILLRVDNRSLTHSAYDRGAFFSRRKKLEKCGTKCTHFNTVQELDLHGVKMCKHMYETVN